MKKFYAHIMIFFLLIIISGCQKNYESILLGTWEGDFPYLGGVRLTFKNNNEVICSDEDVSFELNDEYQLGSDDEIMLETWDWIDYEGEYFIINNESLVIEANCLMGDVQWKIEEIRKDRLFLSGPEGLSMVLERY